MSHPNSAIAVAATAALALSAWSASTFGQTPQLNPPAVTVTAAATASIANDRMHAWLRAEAEHADAATAASTVNARMAGALARAKAVAGVEFATSGYSTYQVTPKGQPSRWRVAQTLTVQGNDFTAITALVGRLQAEDAMLLSGMNFSVGDATRRAAEDKLTQQAIKSWQGRAELAAHAFGYQGWRVGKVAVQTGDSARPYPQMRAAAMSAEAAPPVTVEAGTTDVTVSVTGEAVLESPRTTGR
jgi:predicted secreted protein